jgi:hypothetical protein
VLLNDFCDIVHESRSDDAPHSGCKIDCTYNFNMDEFNVLGHFILAGTLMEPSFASVVAIHDGDNLSDHDPILMILKLDNKAVSLSQKVFSNKIAWQRVDDASILDYQTALNQALR